MAISADHVQVEITLEMTPVCLRVGDQEAQIGHITGQTAAEYCGALARLLRATADEFEAGVP